MLYMDNVNRIIFWWVIPFIFIMYFTFRLFEGDVTFDQGRSDILEQHALNLRHNNEINCLILGGSNSFFSLSAHIMSTKDELNCYNLSLLNEGFSDKAYLDFIRDSSLKKTDIKYVFYSTVYPFSDKDFSERLKDNERGISVIGKSGFSLVGNSIASYLYEWNRYYQNNLIHYPIPTKTGDFDFSKYICKYPEDKKDSNLLDVNSSIINWINGNISSMKNIFFNAKIYLVLPSTLRIKKTDQNFSDFSNLLKQQINDSSIFLVEQSGFKDDSVLCDNINHANEVGREIRTKELINLISETL